MTFKEVIRCSGPGDHYMSFICFMLVCRRWRDILIGETTLWSYITVSGGESVSHALRSIERSGSSQLAVDLVRSRLTPGIHTLLNKLADRSHRLASFRFITSSFPSLPPWRSPAINLRTLILQNAGSLRPLNDFICGPFPQLRSLVLTGFCLWPVVHFRDLHYITLQLPPDHGTVASATLLCMLVASPALREFKISGCKRVSPLPPTSKAVALPHLTLLIIHMSSARDILQYMALPGTVEIRLTRCTNAIGDLLDKTLLSHLGDLSALSTLAVALDNNRSTVTLRGFMRGRSSPSLFFFENLPSGFEVAALKTLEDYAILPAFASVETIIVTNAPSQLPWKSWLSNFPALRRLTIQTRDPAAFPTAIYEEFGHYPVIYPVHAYPSSRRTRSIHVDWRATSNRIRCSLAFDEIPSVPFLGYKPGIASRMRPRPAVVPRPP